MISKISTNGMNHSKWLDQRKKSIGGSDAATIIGLNPYSSPYELWAYKLGKVPPKEENEAMRLGHDLEDYVAKRFCEATGKRVRRENAIIYNDKFPYAHANVDRLIIGEKAGLECKTTSVLNLRKFKDGNFPPVYYVQCQHYMMVTELPKWYLAVLVLGKEFLWFEINRNEEDIQALKEAEQQFWEDVKINDSPPVDGSDSCSDTLSEIYRESDDSEVDLTPLHIALKTRQNLNDQIKELNELKNEQDNKIKAYMQTAEKGSCDAFKVSWKSAVRNTFDSKKYMEDHPNEDFSPYIKKSHCRTFRVTENEA